MQIRKLVKSGHASLVMAVPVDWIKKNKLKPGDLVYINEEANRLNISAESKSEDHEKKEIVINVDGKDPTTVFHEINSAYLSNYYHIIIKGKELPKVSRLIKRCIADLVALELVEESSEKIVARDFVNLNDADVKIIMRRMDNIIRSMIADAKAAVRDHSLVRNIVDRDAELNKLSFFVFKILKAAYVDRKVMQCIHLTEMDLLKYWEVNINLEKIGDRVKNIATVVPRVEPSHRKKWLELFTEIEALYHAVMKALYEPSFAGADLVSQKRRKILAELQNQVNKHNDAACAKIAINAFNMTANINDIARVIMYLS